MDIYPVWRRPWGGYYGYLLCLAFLVTRWETSGGQTFPDGTNGRIAECFIGTGVCYHIIRSVANQEDASLRCQRAGGHLAAVGDAETMATLAGFLHNNSFSKVWIGPKLSEASLQNGRATCGYLVITGRPRVRYQQLSCFDTKKYVCSYNRGPQSMCNPGFEVCGRLCLKKMVTRGPGSTWFTAQQECDKLGAFLPNVSTQSELELTGCSPERRSGLGATWVDRTSVQWQLPTGAPVEYTDWLPGEPTAPLSSFPCVSLVVNSNSFSGWSGTRCSDTLPFICQKKFITTVALQMVTQSSETGQPAEGSAGGRDPGNRDPGGRDRGRDRDNDRLTTGEAGSTGSPGKGSVRHPPKRPPHPTPAPGNQNMGLYIGMGVLAVVVVATTTSCIFLLVRRRRSKRRSALKDDSSMKSVISRADNPNYEALIKGKGRAGGKPHEGLTDDRKVEYDELPSHQYMTINEEDMYDQLASDQRGSSRRQKQTDEQLPKTNIAAMKASGLRNRELPPTPDSVAGNPHTIDDEYIEVIPPPADYALVSRPANKRPSSPNDSDKPTPGPPGGHNENQDDTSASGEGGPSPGATGDMTLPPARIGSIMVEENCLYGTSQNEDEDKLDRDSSPVPATKDIGDSMSEREAVSKQTLLSERQDQDANDKNS